MTKKTVHQVKVTLQDIRPPIWRRIVVPSEMTLAELAAVLEAAMGWFGGHLHLFDIDGTIYGMRNPMFEDLGLDESEYRLGAVLPEVGSKMRWSYDFGDGWEHTVLVEAIEPPNSGVDYPICLAGKRACPPEDCGGPWGYGNLLEVLADPSHSDHEEMQEWAPPDFDPAEFDIAEATAYMHSPRPLQGW